jgi:hypothetical protein
MLELEGNLTFARNLLRQLFATRGGRLVIVTGGFSLSGEPSRALAEQPGVVGWLGRLNGFLIGLSDYTVVEAAMRLTALALALLAGLIAVRVLPRRGLPLDGSWTRVPVPDTGPDASGMVATLEGPTARSSYTLPATIVRDNVERRLAALLAVEDPLTAVPPNELRALVTARAGAEAGVALSALLPLLRGLPSRSQAQSPWQVAALGRRDFDRLAAATERLYRSLDAVTGAERA